MKTKIILHGRLKNQFRKEFEFYNISRARDCFNAISCTYPDFKNQIKRDSLNGINYQIVINGELVENEKTFNKKRKIETIEIVPTVIGSDVGAMFVYFLVSVAIAGIMYLMTPIPEIQPQEISQEVSATSQSYMLGSNSNLAAQGQAVPIRYGLLRVGSSIISSRIRNENMYDPGSYRTVSTPILDWSEGGSAIGSDNRYMNLNILEE